MLSYVHFVLLFYICCCCFFFKQMTAYEMRISDWSSDVCSSDLLAEHLVIARKLLTEHPADERHALSLQLTTDRYDIHWAPSSPPPPALAPGLERMRRQIVDRKSTRLNSSH